PQSHREHRDCTEKDKERKQTGRESGAPSNRGRQWLARLGFSLSFSLFLCLLSVFSVLSVSSTVFSFACSLFVFLCVVSVLSVTLWLVRFLFYVYRTF